MSYFVDDAPLCEFFAILVHEVKNMSNVKHPDCPIRQLAQEAKRRMKLNDYVNYGALDKSDAKSSLTPMETQVYKKMKELLDNGVEVENPILQLSDKDYMKSLPPQDRQRYILEVSNAYLSLKSKMQTYLNEKA